LAHESGFDCLLAVGPPSRENAIHFYKHNAGTADVQWPERGEGAFHFGETQDSKPGELWLMSNDYCTWFKVMEAHHNHRPLDRAYEAARSARFEFGESGSTVRPKTYADLHCEREKMFADAARQRRSAYGRENP
jgi:hypothetical protein